MGKSCPRAILVNGWLIWAVGIKAVGLLEGASLGMEVVPLEFFFAPMFRPFWISWAFAIWKDDAGVAKGFVKLFVYDCGL